MANQKITTTDKVISSDGELLSENISIRTINKVVRNQEHFIRTYLADIGALTKCSKSEQSVVLACLKYIDFNSNEILLNHLRRIDICEEAGLGIDSINGAISRLVRKNIFIKRGSSSYLLNPKLFFYGIEAERDKLFTLQINYEIIDLK